MYFDCMYVCMYGFVPCVCLVPLKFITSPKTRVRESCETPCRHWKSNQDPFPTELFTTESTFKPCELVLVSDSLNRVYHWWLLSASWHSCLTCKVSGVDSGLVLCGHLMHSPCLILRWSKKIPFSLALFLIMSRYHILATSICNV